LDLYFFNQILNTNLYLFMQSKRFNKVSPALERYKPGEISKIENLYKNQKYNNKLINENFNRSLMITNNLDKGHQINQNQRIQETTNGVDNITNKINKLSMDDAFKELQSIANNNSKENTNLISKKNFCFFDNYTKIPNLLIRISNVTINNEKGILSKKGNLFIYLYYI